MTNMLSVSDFKETLDWCIETNDEAELRFMDMCLLHGEMSVTETDTRDARKMVSKAIKQVLIRNPDNA